MLSRPLFINDEHSLFIPTTLTDVARRVFRRRPLSRHLKEEPEQNELLKAE